MRLSIASKICLAIAVAIMICFFAMQTALVIGYQETTHTTTLIGWLSVVLFMPFFFFVVVEFVRQTRYKFQTIDDTLSAINESNMLVEFELDGTIVSCNDIFCNVMGYNRDELIGTKHKQFTTTHDFDLTKYQSFWYDLKRGKIKSGEFMRKTKSGALVWIYGNYNPIKNPYGETYRVLKIATDITDKKNIEIEVGKKNAYLEHAAKILRHDMHSGINTYIPRGLSSLKRRLTDDQIKTMKIGAPIRMIQEGLTHTQRVYKGVKEFTNLVKLDSQLEKNPHDLREILTNYLDATAYFKQVILNDLIVCNVNDSLFCTAIDNFIRNGLKYNDAPTKVVSLYMENDSTLVIEDNGRGMSQSDFEQLSKPYTRRDGQKENGTGLGLNICVAIMDEHGFGITAEKLEQGTKIRIHIQ